MSLDSAPQVCPPGHPHDATTNCYAHHRCRCAKCRAASSAAKNARRRLKAYGRWEDPYVPVEPVREHLRYLLAHSMGLQRIAVVAGVSYNAVYAPIYGHKARRGEMNGGRPTSRIKRESAEKILAVRADLVNLAPGATIPSRGVQRRMQALQARGWAFSHLSNRIGIDQRSVRFMKSDRVTVRVHLKVAALYEDLWDQLPPRQTRYDRTVYGKAIAAAKRHGWLPPLAWDDIDNDPEPPAVDEVTIDEFAIELVLAGQQVRLNRPERELALRALHARRWSDARIGRAIGCDARTVLRIRTHLELPAFDQNELIDAEAA